MNQKHEKIEAALMMIDDEMQNGDPSLSKRRMAAFIDRDREAVMDYLRNNPPSEGSPHAAVYEALADNPNHWARFLVEEFQHLCKLLDYERDEDKTDQYAWALDAFMYVAVKESKWKDKFVAMAIEQARKGSEKKQVVLFEILGDIYYDEDSYPNLNKFVEESAKGSYGIPMQESASSLIYEKSQKNGSAPELKDLTKAQVKQQLKGKFKGLKYKISFFKAGITALAALGFWMTGQLDGMGSKKSIIIYVLLALTVKNIVSGMSEKKKG